jgi:hypothetical protein
MTVRALFAAIAALFVAGAAQAAAVVDHIQVAASDLAAGSRAVAELTGVTPQVGGVHPGRGTANALMSLGPRTYLEVITPAPGQPATTPMAQELAGVKGIGVRTFAVAASDLDTVAAAARKAGLGVDGPTPGSRQTPQGQLLKWRALTPTSPEFGLFIPFFIDWGDTVHPATTSPAGAKFTRLRVIHPKAAELRRIYAALGLDIEVTQGAEPQMILEISGPKGAATIGGERH